MVKPRGQVSRSNQPKKAYAKIGEPQFEITAWCPDDKAQLPPEQVHFIVHWPAQLADLPPLVIRFKSPDTIGFFIEELTEYRRTVWPHCEAVKSENEKLLNAAKALLKKIDNITTDQFSKGAEREEREALRQAIAIATAEAEASRPLGPG